MKRHKSKVHKNLEYLNKIGRRRVLNASKFFRRNLHLNHKDLQIQIIMIKNKQQFFEETKGFKEMKPDVCFFLYHIYYNDLSDWLLMSKDREMILTDSATNKIIGFNEDIKKYPDFVNVWITKKKIPELKSMKVNDILFTR